MVSDDGSDTGASGVRNGFYQDEHGFWNRSESGEQDESVVEFKPCLKSFVIKEATELSTDPGELRAAVASLQLPTPPPSSRRRRSAEPQPQPPPAPARQQPSAPRPVSHPCTKASPAPLPPATSRAAVVGSSSAAPLSEGAGDDWL